MKKAKPFTESASSTEAAYAKFESTRRNVENKKALLIKAEQDNSEAYSVFYKLKEAHERSTREMR